MNAQPKLEPSSTLGEAAARALSIECRALCEFEWKGKRVRAGQQLHVRDDELRELFRQGLVILA
jgi:hypothetical protein